MTYYANYSVNGGTSLAKPLAGDNKKKLLNTIRKWAKETIFCQTGATGWFWVWTEDKDGEITYIYEGYIEMSKQLTPVISYTFYNGIVQ